MVAVRELRGKTLYDDHQSAIRQPPDGLCDFTVISPQKLLHSNN